MPDRQVNYLNPEGACRPDGLCSHIGKVDSGPLALIGGQLAVDAGGNIVGICDFDAQFAQVFENLGAMLNGLGANFNHVVKFTTYLVESYDVDKFMRAQAALFPRLFANDSYPPNTLLVVDRLVKEEFLIEVEAVVRV